MDMKINFLPAKTWNWLRMNETEVKQVKADRQALEKEEIIEVKKQFVGRKPNTSYKVTSGGVELFKKHIDALEKLINPLS